MDGGTYCLLYTANALGSDFSGQTIAFQNLCQTGPVDLLGKVVQMLLRNSIFALLNADITVFPKRQFTVPTGIKVGDQCFQYRAFPGYKPNGSSAMQSSG